MKPALVSILFILFFQSIGQIESSTEGKYAARIFTSEEYNAGNDVLCFVQDQQGILYSGNSKGISIYNGATWKLVELPNKSEVLWLSVDHEDHIYVAGNEEFGLLKKEDGIVSFQSLTHLLPDSIRGFGSIWEVESTSYGTYFRTSTYLFWYHNSQLDILPMTDYDGGKFDVIFSVNDTLHLRKRKLGLGRMIGKSFELLPEGKFFEKIKTNAIMALDDQVLIATRKEGLFISYNNGIKEFENEIQQILKDARIYHATTHHNSVAIATLTQGVYILDKRGRLIKHINEQKYDINETTNFVYFDTQDALWIGTLNGMMRVDFQDQFKVFDAIKGSNIVVFDFLKYKDIFYFATSTGVFYSRTNDFKNAKKVEGINDPCYTFSIVDDRIFVHVNSGIFLINKELEGVKQGSVYGFVANTQVENCYFIGGQEGLILANYNEKGLKIKKTLQVGKNIESLYEFAANELWLFPKNNGITYYNLNSDSLANFSLFGDSKAIEIEGEPVFITAKGVYEYDKNENEFVSSSFFYQYVDSTQHKISEVNTDSDGNILILYSDKLLNVHGLWLNKTTNDSYEPYQMPDINLNMSNFTTTYLEQDGIIWFAGNNQIIRIDIPNTSKKNRAFTVHFNNIYAKNERIPITKSNLRIPFSSNDIRFEYAAIYYNSYGNNVYQYFLEGVDSDWSEWADQNRKEYSYLREGNYTFKVRAKNPNDIISNISSFQFTILSPWYRSKIAFLIYFLLIIFVILIVSRIRSAKLQKRNSELIKLVDERTAEVVSKNQKLEELSELKSKFFANISHELRTPLTLINGQLESIQRSTNSTDNAHRIESSRRNAAQLGNMIEDLLDLSKLELNQSMINPNPVDIKSNVIRMISSFQSLAESKEIELHIDDQLIEPIYASLDIRQFEKVINNLAYNAFKFTNKNGKIEATISSNQDHAFIKVFDNGVGIEEDELPHIFDRFYQAKNHVSSEMGSGLGLAISKEIIELHDGTINVSSDIGKGTTFTIALPRIFGDFTKEDLTMEDESSSIENFMNEKIFKKGVDKPTILIVEDTIEMRFYLKEILSPTFNIHEASNGLEGLQSLKDNKIDLIISDVMMPIMTGIELLDEIKKSVSFQQIPVILLTAKSSKEDRMEGLRFGIDDYITKPFDRDELLIRVANLVHNFTTRLALAKEMPDEEKKDELPLSSEDEKTIKTAKQYVESRISESSLSVSDVASSVAMSERQFYRKLAKLTGMTPANFIMEIRLYHIRKLLLNGDMIKLSQAASEIGISSPSYFSKLFFERFGKKPTEYLNK